MAASGVVGAASGSLLVGSSLPVANTVASSGIDDLSSTLQPPTLDGGLSSSSVSLRANTGSSPSIAFVRVEGAAVDADRAGLAQPDDR